MLSRAVFMSLYTLGMKAKESRPENRQAMAMHHEKMITEYLVSAVGALG